mgnify:CR=1 FL=1
MALPTRVSIYNLASPAPTPTSRPTVLRVHCTIVTSITMSTAQRVHNTALCHPSPRPSVHRPRRPRHNCHVHQHVQRVRSCSSGRCSGDRYTCSTDHESDHQRPLTKCPSPVPQVRPPASTAPSPQVHRTIATGPPCHRQHAGGRGLSRGGGRAGHLGSACKCTYSTPYTCIVTLATQQHQ